MIIIKKIFNLILNFLLFIGFIRKKKQSLRILMFHDINDFKKFEKIIVHLKKDWKFISPDSFLRIYNNKNKIKKKLILLTFDDGFKSNLIVAEKILSKHNIKAIFFIPFEFIMKKNKLKKRNFILKNLNFKNGYNNLNSMSLADLKKLIRFNHKIGAHTYSHKDLKFVKNKRKLNFEIIDSTDRFQKKINKKITLFAFNFGRLKNISPQMVKIASKRYNFLFSAIRGENKINSKLLFRDNISPNDNLLDINIYLNGGYDFLYKKERDELLSFLD